MQNYSLFDRILEKMPSLYLSEISSPHSLIRSIVFANVIKQFDGIAKKKTAEKNWMNREKERATF